MKSFLRLLTRLLAWIALGLLIEWGDAALRHHQPDWELASVRGIAAGGFLYAYLVAQELKRTRRDTREALRNNLRISIDYVDNAVRGDNRTKPPSAAQSPGPVHPRAQHPNMLDQMEAYEPDPDQLGRRGDGQD